jgi:hypothetical protein
MLKANQNARVVSLVLNSIGCSYTFFETETGSIHNAAGKSVTKELEHLVGVVSRTDGQVKEAIAGPISQLQLLKAAVASRMLPGDLLQEARNTIRDMEEKLETPLKKAKAIRSELESAMKLLEFAKLFDYENSPKEEVPVQAAMSENRAKELLQNSKAIAERLSGLTERLSDMNKVSSAKVQTENPDKAPLPENIRSLAGSLLGQLIGAEWMRAHEAKPEERQAPVEVQGCGEPDCFHCGDADLQTDVQKGPESIMPEFLARRDKTDGMMKPIFFRLNPGESIEDGVRRALNIEGDFHLEFGNPDMKTFH